MSAVLLSFVYLHVLVVRSGAERATPANGHPGAWVHHRRAAGPPGAVYESRAVLAETASGQSPTAGVGSGAEFDPQVLDMKATSRTSLQPICFAWFAASSQF